jgi:hypothetical protein
MLFNTLKNIVNAKTQKNIVNESQVIENECIWSKTGMVQSKLCDNAYDCPTCPLDRAMQKTFNADPQRKSAGWANNPCRHALTGRVSAAKVCVNNYECNHCAYDQMIDDENMDFRDEKLACLTRTANLREHPITTYQ